jgi:hypothetical protein
MSMTNSTPKICIIFNLRINSTYRLDRLLKLLRKLAPNSDAYFSIRIRGVYSNLAHEKIIQLFSTISNQNFKVYRGDDFKQWKMNTFMQVNESNCQNILLLQEDHYLISSPDALNSFIKECIDEITDIGFVTAWFTYKEFRDRTYMLDEFKSGSSGVYTVLSRIPWNFLSIEKPRYLVPLVAFFNRDFLVKILLSPRPFWRKYPANSPFDFEQSPWAKWLLPIKIGFSNQELFACIDDDIDVPGTSLQSRNLYPSDNLRKGEHHTSAPFGIQKNLDLFRKHLPLYLGNDSIFKSLKNQKSKFVWSHVSNWVYRSARKIDSIFYSTHNLLNYFLNFPEIYYKLNSKSHNSMKSDIQNDY